MTWGTVCQQVAPPPGFWMTATSAVITSWWRGSDRTRRRGEWDFSHLKGTPPIISRVLRLCFHMLRIHYCFCLIPSARHWQMKLKYAADTQQQTPRRLSTTVSLPQRVCKFLQGNALRAKKKKKTQQLSNVQPVKGGSGVKLGGEKHRLTN